MLLAPLSEILDLQPVHAYCILLQGMLHINNSQWEDPGNGDTVSQWLWNSQRTTGKVSLSNGGSRIFPMGVRQLPNWDYFTIFFLPKTAWKWKNLDPGGGWRASLAPPLDPPMLSLSNSTNIRSQSVDSYCWVNVMNVFFIDVGLNVPKYLLYCST